MKMSNHFDKDGNYHMVDVSEKPDTVRVAVAYGKIYLNDEIITNIKNNSIKKGDVLSISQIAGIMGAKKTSDIIPLCHPIFTSNVSVVFEVFEDHIKSIAKVKTIGKTGVEMEALTAVSISLLTIYDMCKYIDKSMKITDIHLIEKTGGKSSFYKHGH